MNNELGVRMSLTPSNNSSSNGSSTAASWATLEGDRFLSAKDALILGQSHSHEDRLSSHTGTGSPESRSSMDLSEVKRISLVQSVGEKEDENTEENEGIQVRTSQTQSRELQDVEGRAGMGSKEKDIESSSSPPPMAITFPDGGVRAWSNVAGCTLVSLTAFGQVNAFGVFQSYYAANQLKESSASDISWIGGVQIALLYISGLILGRVFDKYGARGLLTCGCILSTICAVLLSFCTQYYQIFLAQAVGMGLGIAMQFYPLLVIPSHWFKRRRAIAIGIVVAGSSLGGIIYPIMLSNLFTRIGFAWSVRAMALVMFVLQAVSIPFIKERMPPSKAVRVFDFGAFREWKFALHCLGAFFSAFGLYTPFWYIELFMQSRGSSTSLAFYSIAIMNAAGVIGRIGSGWIADRFGRFNTLVPVAVIQAVSVFAIWTTARDVPQTIVFAVIFGISSASYSSVASSCVAQITQDPSLIGTRTGMFTAAMAPGILAGPPIAGALLAFRSHDTPSSSGEGDFFYLWAQFFGGAMLVTGAVLAGVARLACTRSIRVKI